MTDLNNGLSPLIECPCTDRITKSTVQFSSIKTVGTCPQGLKTELECKQNIESMNVTLKKITSTKDPDLPQGCILMPEKESGFYSAVYNTPKAQRLNMTCGSQESVSLRGHAKLGPEVNMSLSHDTKTVVLTLSGPANVWFGVGFDASTMADKPYAIIVDGAGAVTERKLENHAPGTLLQPGSIEVLYGFFQEFTCVSIILCLCIDSVSEDCGQHQDCCDKKASRVGSLQLHHKARRHERYLCCR